MSAILALVLLAAAKPSPELVLERMQAAQAKLKSLSARLEQSKSYPQLGIEDPLERGFLYFERGKLRIEIQEPETRILVVKGGSYILYQPRIRQAISGKLEGAGRGGSFSLLLAGSLEAVRELRSAYVVSDLGKENVGERTVHHLELRARPGARVYCQQMELFVDAALLLPVRQKCREPNGSVIDVSLSHIERDRTLSKEVFEIEIPEDVERIQGGGGK